ncbi:18804_t:CDS:2 [Rhizophagus irregularis]|nr:18804_t:CDS:2 [Rhizophagus irregularis]
MSPVTLNCLVAGENSYENDLKLITDIIFNDKAAAQFMLYQRNLGVVIKDLQQRAKMEDNEAQLAEQLLNSGWNKLVKTVKDFVIVDKSEEATVSTYVDGQNQCMSKVRKAILSDIDGGSCF